MHCQFKKIFFLNLFNFLILNCINAQEFYSINKTLYSKDGLNQIYKNTNKYLKKTGQDVSICYFRINRIDIKGDSIINYGNLTGASKENKEPIFSLINKPFPNLSLEEYIGETITNDSLQGKPTIINLWFTTCAPCIQEIPTLNQLKEKYGDSLNYLAITYEDRKIVKRFLKKHNFTFNILINGRKLLDNIGNESYPKILVIDKNNIIRYIDFGFPETKNDISNRYDDFTDLIEILLKQKKT